MKRIHEKTGRSVSQVLRLCVKDFTCNKGTGLLVVAVYLLWISLIIAIENKFTPIMVIFPIFMIDALKRFEDRYKIEVLFCSLPVKRSSLVAAKYLSSLLIIIITALVSYLSVLLLDTLWPMVLQGADEMVTAPQVFFILFIYGLFTAVSFLIYSRFGYPGYPLGIIIDVLATLMTAMMTWGLLYLITSLVSGSWGLEQYGGEAGLVEGFFNGVTGKTVALLGEDVFFVLMGFWMVALIFASISLSVKFYRKRDL